MPIRIFTVPFNEETQTFHDDLVQQFCVNKRVHKIETKFFTKNGHPFWTVAVHYGVILENEERMARQMEKIKDTEFGLDDAQKALLVRLKEFRREQAEQKGFPVYLVATNAQLANMVRNKCTTLESLKLIKGFGKSRIEQYGKGFTHIIKTFHTTE